MTDFEKRVVLNEWIRNKSKHCKETSLLSDNEKRRLRGLIKYVGEETDDFLTLIADELKEFKKYQKAESYVYTYKQAQSLVFCCRCLGYEVEVDVIFDRQEIEDILKDFDMDFDIIRELDYLFLDYIKITKKGEKKNENYKNKTKASV